MKTQGRVISAKLQMPFSTTPCDDTAIPKTRIRILDTDLHFGRFTLFRSVRASLSAIPSLQRFALLFDFPVAGGGRSGRFRL